MEDNPLKAKTRKANQANLSTEMRQMEEQYVFSVSFLCRPTFNRLRRFTSYDFKQMQRRSYYPHNQHIISTVTATSSGMVSSRPVTPANDLRVDSGIAINGNSLDLNVIDAEAIRGEKMISEKDYQ